MQIPSKFIPFLLLFISLISVKGIAQSVNELDQKHGFKGITIGKSIFLYLSYFDRDTLAENTRGYTIYHLKKNPPYNPKINAKIGFIPLQKLTVLVYKNLIHEIRINAHAQYANDVKDILLKTYGEPNQQECTETELEEGARLDCIWKGQKIGLVYSYIDSPNYNKVVIGLQNYLMTAKMRKELINAAVDDLK